MMRPDISIKAALSNLVNFVLKFDEAPASAQAHLDHAIFILSEMEPGMKAADEEVRQVVLDAREHMSYYFDQAKTDWPNP